MQTEEDFRRALDAAPADDFQLRLVFADWLQDRDDPRADGLRVLAAMRFVPRHEINPFFCHGVWYPHIKESHERVASGKTIRIPDAWMRALVPYMHRNPEVKHQFWLVEADLYAHSVDFARRSDALLCLAASFAEMAAEDRHVIASGAGAELAFP